MRAARGRLNWDIRHALRDDGHPFCNLPVGPTLPEDFDAPLPPHAYRCNRCLTILGRPKEDRTAPPGPDYSTFTTSRTMGSLLIHAADPDTHRTACGKFAEVRQHAAYDPLRSHFPEYLYCIRCLERTGVLDDEPTEAANARERLVVARALTHYRSHAPSGT